jgi:hypothetical protein
MAQIGWIDFSPDHRDRVAAVLSMLKPEGMVDELGIGRVRDAFANQMFPGISTIQTRAKYFFLVPYLLYEYQRLPLAQQRRIHPEKYLETQEFEVMWKLADTYDHKEGTGVIGITKYKPEKIMRRPSAIYWNGLAVFGLVRHRGLGVNTFLRSRSEKADSLASDALQGDDSPRDDIDAEHINTFELGLPYDRKWLDSLTLDLTASEATLMADRLRAAGKDLLLGDLMTNKGRFKVFKKAQSFSDFARVAESQDLLSASVKPTVVLAHDFSELMFGAHCAYNCALQTRKYSSDPFEDDWSEWIKNLRHRMLRFKGFDPEKVLAMTPTLRVHTRKFLLQWWDFVTAPTQSIKARNELIATQELAAKGPKARIRQNKLDDVPEGQWIGLGHLDYRMTQVKTIIQDVYTGLGAA